MPLPHFAMSRMPPFSLPTFVMGDYKEYVYIGEDLDGKPYIWDENLPIKLIKNTKYKLYCRIYENVVDSEVDNSYIHIYIDRYDKTFTTKMTFADLINQKLMMPISEYRDIRINEILD